MQKLGLCLAFMALIVSTLACGGGRASIDGESPAGQIPATSTPVPIPTALDSIPATLPDDDDLRALIIYANEMSPILIAASEILQRDGEILK